MMVQPCWYHGKNPKLCLHYFKTLQMSHAHTKAKTLQMSHAHTKAKTLQMSHAQTKSGL
jgi:hypothetical protein